MNLKSNYMLQENVIFPFISNPVLHDNLINFFSLKLCYLYVRYSVYLIQKKSSRAYVFLFEQIQNMQEFSLWPHKKGGFCIYKIIKNG